MDTPSTYWLIDLQSRYNS
ncbi:MULTISPECIES: YsgD/CorL family protein [Erwinia]